MKTSWVVGAMLSLAGCASPLPPNNIQKSFESGRAAEFVGDYPAAERNYQRALASARLAASPNWVISNVTYSLGRVKGYLCKYDDAEKLLRDSLQLEEGVSGPESGTTTMRLFDLARLYYDRGQYAASIPYFARAVPTAKSLGIASRDPIALADALDEYATALEREAKSTEATAIKREADSLRDDNPGRRATFKPLRYATACTATPPSAALAEEYDEATATLRIEWANPVDFFSGKGSNIVIQEVNGRVYERPEDQDRQRILIKEVPVRAGANLVGVRAWSHTSFKLGKERTSRKYLCLGFDTRPDHVYTLSIAGPEKEWAPSIQSEGPSGTNNVSVTVTPGGPLPCKNR